MQTSIKSPRNGCGLHGALQTVSEIRGIVPIVHANAGCSIQNYLANKSSGLGNAPISGEEIFSTDAQERHVIFGGASRLREQIKNTIKVAEGDLYIVLNSCESAMVGDDVEAMTRESREQGETIIECLTAGFHGDSHYGYESVVADIVKKISLVKNVEEEKNEKLVNIFGIIPQKDVYFKGNLLEIKRILEGIGLEVNTFFGFTNGVEEFTKASAASLNIVFSKWGRGPAEVLEDKYGIPELEWEGIPIGPDAVFSFLKSVADQLNIPEEVVKEFIEKEEAEFDYYYQGIIDSFYEEIGGRSIAIVGDESIVISISTFLKKYLGASVDVAVVTDYFGKQDLSKEEKSKTVVDIAKEVYFTQDGKEIRDIILNNDVDIVLGSSLEKQIIENRGLVSLDVSYPVYGKTITNRTYAGIKGALTLIEDYLTTVKEANSLKQQSLFDFIKQQ